MNYAAKIIKTIRVNKDIEVCAIVEVQTEKEDADECLGVIEMALEKEYGDDD